MTLYQNAIRTPLGTMIAITGDEGIYRLDFTTNTSDEAKALLHIHKYTGCTTITGRHPYMDILEKQLTAYFSGAIREFDLPLRFCGTAFQIRVWEELLRIPYSQTRTYKAQATALGQQQAIRAIARANGENGLAIIVPCHRVIGTNGSLTGYAGGLARKQWLLDHERKHSGTYVQQGLFDHIP